MKPYIHLTNESLRNRFANQFELVNYAIKLAEHLILSGRKPFSQHDPENLSTYILELIATGKDYFKDVASEAMLIADVERRISSKISPAIIVEDYDDEDEDEDEEEESEPQEMKAI